MSDSTSAFIERLIATVGRSHVLTEPADCAPYLTDWRGAFRADALAVVRPATTTEVAAVVRVCAQTRVAVVAQGGNTGLCGGSVPVAGQSLPIVLSLSRLNRIRAIDLDNDTITVEAGCVLANLQKAADQAGRLFPLSLAAEGTCQIGGNLSTNAGGVQVLRYGNMRELVFGLEVVLADGRLWTGLKGLRKDNTGYDLKHLFVGGEGTLGIITAAVLKLFPRPVARAVAIVAVPTPSRGVELLRLFRGHCGDRLTAFEIFERVCLDLVLKHIPGSVDPLPSISSEHPEPVEGPWYVLAELSDTLPADLQHALETPLAAAIERGIALDAVIATSEAQAKALWALRENISEAQRLEGASIKHDISVPVSRIPEFISRADEALNVAFPGIRIVCFGHIGDGNLHYNCSRADAQDNRDFITSQPTVNRIVYDLVDALGGSISAEHGLGQLKRGEIARYKSAVEIELMQRVKRALDPDNLMNPGKLLP